MEAYRNFKQMHCCFTASRDVPVNVSLIGETLPVVESVSPREKYILILRHSPDRCANYQRVSCRVDRVFYDKIVMFVQVQDMVCDGLSFVYGRNLYWHENASKEDREYHQKDIEHLSYWVWEQMRQLSPHMSFRMCYYESKISSISPPINMKGIL